MSNPRVNIHNSDNDLTLTNEDEMMMFFATQQIRQRHPHINTGTANALFAMLEMASMYREIVEYAEEAEFEAALQESEENYKSSERKNIKLNINFKKYEPVVDTETCCSICQEDFTTEDMVSILNCKHMFHKMCIIEWGKFKPECPVCRAEIDHKEVNVCSTD